MKTLEKGWAKRIPIAVLEALMNAIGGNGHGIWNPEFILKTGLDPEIVAVFAREHSSGSDFKSTIFVDGKPVDNLGGVYGLDLIESISHSLGLGGSNCMGRGFRAQECTAKIRKFIEAQKGAND